MASAEQELLSRARGGDRAAIERLLEKHEPRVFRFGKRMCGGDDDAEEVLQETLLAAARSLPEFRGTSSLSTWLYAIARSFCIKRRRSGKGSELVESLDASGSAAPEVADPRRGPEEVTADAQLRSVLQEAISALEPMYREVLVLRDVEGLSASEVAEVLGVSVEAVKSRLHRARVAVRERVAPALAVPEAQRAAARAAPGEVCPDIVELFSRHLEGEVSGGVCANLEKHLEACDGCRARCDSLRATLALCSSSGEEVPPHVARSVREALRRFLETVGERPAGTTTGGEGSTAR